MQIDARARQELEASGFFDAAWYLASYPDVVELGLDPLDHYLWLGRRIGRNPGPGFDAAAYLARHRDVADSGYDPVLHYIRYGRTENRQIQKVRLREPMPDDGVTQPRPIQRIPGYSTRRQGRRTVLLCAHVAGRELYGSERSLIDMLDALAAMDCNIVVAVPDTSNSAYLERLKAQSVAVLAMPYPWWTAARPIDEIAVAGFAQIIAEERIDIVHVNTIVLRDPRIAARRMGIPVVVHARELITHDEALLTLMGVEAPEVIEAVWQESDLLIANSQATAACFDQPGRTGRTSAIVYNTADIDLLATLPGPATSGKLRVGLISSNVPKKGIWDFAAVAAAVAAHRDDVEFLLIGPQHDHTAEIEAKIADGRLPACLKLAGYRKSPAEAIAETDVVLSLSQFRESFGRTVLEAMAAARPVVVYDHGAPPELVIDGDTGHVVPTGDTDAVAAKVIALAEDRIGLLKMGLKAQDHARRTFGRDAYNAAMAAAYMPLLTRTAAPLPRMVLPARALPERIDRAALKIAYFCWHFPVPSETFVLNELRLLVAQGFDVKVYCRQSPYPDFTPDFEIDWERVGSPDDLAAKLTETGRQVVHSHFVYPTVTDMVWPACEKAGVPFTFIAHAQDIFRYRNDALNRIDEVAASPMCRRVFVPSRFHYDYLARRGVPGSKMTINPNGIDPALYAAGRNPRRAARAARRIVAVHRFTEKKGLIHLIRAAADLAESEIQIDLYGYGELEDDYAAEIRRLKLTNVALRGPVNGREEMLALFRDSDLFACPSVRAADGDMDGIPTVVMEAMAAGLPVLVSELSGIPDLVQDGITGLVAAAEPTALAARIRDFYALPDAAVAAIIEDADLRIAQDYDTNALVEYLVRVWAGETLDLMIVAWNNLAQTREVIRRLYAHTALPFHLVVCDNGSDPDALAHHLAVYAAQDNVTLVLNRENAFVGPGTNICLEHGTSDIAIYVCGKEGMVTRHGWERGFVETMRLNPRVGQAGTLCHSPSYLHGRDYPEALDLFPDFRNPDFARDNPNRPFAHVQGGFFAIRRAMFDEIGGFSDVVNHNYTDVEFSYYVESCGWDLAEVPRVMALFNKTRPGLLNRVDDSHGALHPPLLEDMPALDRIARREIRHCNLCAAEFDAFVGGDDGAICPSCGSTRRSRSLYRVLAESILLYRRLPALGVGIPEALQEFWKFQFQGRMLPGEEFGQNPRHRRQGELP